MEFYIVSFTQKIDPYKKSIEENFKSIKTTLSQESESGKKQLYPEQREWSV